MWARMVHSIPPLLGSSCQLHFEDEFGPSIGVCVSKRSPPARVPRSSLFKKPMHRYSHLVIIDQGQCSPLRPDMATNKLLFNIQD